MSGRSVTRARAHLKPAEASESPDRDTPANAGAVPTIRVDVNLGAMVDQAIASLVATDVYQRSGELVDVIRDASRDGGVIRPVGAPRLRSIPSPRLQERIAVKEPAWRRQIVHDES